MNTHAEPCAAGQRQLAARRGRCSAAHLERARERAGAALALVPQRARFVLVPPEADAHRLGQAVAHAVDEDGDHDEDEARAALVRVVALRAARQEDHDRHQRHHAGHALADQPLQRVRPVLLAVDGAEAQQRGREAAAHGLDEQVKHDVRRPHRPQRRPPRLRGGAALVGPQEQHQRAAREQRQVANLARVARVHAAHHVQ